MTTQTCASAICKCSYGSAPSALMVLPTNRTLTCKKPAANIMDHIPLLNILPFGLCSSLANPTVAAATAANFGVLTPMPCIPATAAPWITGSSTVLIGKFPALTNTSKLMCSYAGMIKINFPGQVTVKTGG